MQKIRDAVLAMKVAYYGFYCPICRTYVKKGSNYLERNGFKICIQCGESH